MNNNTKQPKIPIEKTALLSFSSNFLHDNGIKNNQISNYEQSLNQNNNLKILEYKKVHFITKFAPIQDLEIFNKELDENKCVTVLRIIDEKNIKCLIFVKKDKPKTEPEKAMDESKEDDEKIEKRRLSLNPLKILRTFKRRSSKLTIDADRMVIPNGEANLVWSNDLWKTWNIIEATYLQQTNDCLIYEANLKNIDKLVENGKTIEFVSCYQNDEGVFKDTNNDKCYIFERIDKLIKLEI